jgi:co-chaperonin GroES (HSP10)
MAVKFVFFPTGDKILVRDADHENVTEGGLILPDNRQRKDIAYGQVMHAGPDVQDIHRNDWICFPPYRGVLFNRENEGNEQLGWGVGDFRVIQPEDVLGIMVEDDGKNSNNPSD